MWIQLAPKTTSSNNSTKLRVPHNPPSSWGFSTLIEKGIHWKFRFVPPSVNCCMHAWGVYQCTYVYGVLARIGKLAIDCMQPSISLISTTLLQFPHIWLKLPTRSIYIYMDASIGLAYDSLCNSIWSIPQFVTDDRVDHTLACLRQDPLSRKLLCLCAKRFSACQISEALEFSGHSKSDPLWEVAASQAQPLSFSPRGL